MISLSTIRSLKEEVADNMAQNSPYWIGNCLYTVYMDFVSMMDMWIQ